MPPTLDFENLMDKQRQFLKDLSPPVSKNAAAHSVKSEKEWISNWQFERIPSSLKIPTTKMQTSVAPTIESSEEKEWISNWQFERVPSIKKPTMMPANQVTPPKSNSPSNTDQGAVFFVQSIANTPPTIRRGSHITPSKNDSPSDVDEGGDFFFERITTSQKQHNFDDSEFDLDMTIENDDLFADLEAAAVTNDDSEMFLDDLIDMDMDVDNQDQVQDCNDKFMRSFNASQSADVKEFLNESKTLISNDDDIMMTNDDDKRIHSVSSPTTTKESLSTLPFGSNNTDSPKSVVHHVPAQPLRLLNASMTSANTRPALQHMRKMMTSLLESGNMPQRQPRNSQLPCAEGMDEMYLDTVRKLSASMERSKKTRESLSIPMQNSLYNRSNSQIVQSVQTSSRHVNTCLRSISMMNQ